MGHCGEGGGASPLQTLGGLAGQGSGLREHWRASRSQAAGRGGFEAEGGEFIVNKRSAAKYADQLIAMNAEGVRGATAPRVFANGGFAPAVAPNTSVDTAKMAEMIGEEIAARISAIAVTNVATATTSMSRMVQNAEAMATF